MVQLQVGAISVVIIVFFISYINITTSIVTTYQTTQLATNGNGITATSATNSGYNPSNAIDWSTANSGVWWSGNNANTGVLTATMSGGWMGYK